MENLRTSSYIIPVKLEKEENKYMLLHGYTGAIDIVSSEMLNKINNVSVENNLSDETLQTLLKRGYVTTKTQEEEWAYVARMAKALHKKEDIIHTSFTWIVTYNCNFRCPYCYEARDKKDGKTKMTFTKEQVDIAYKAQDIIQPNMKLRKKSIILYGGEPLMADNKEIVNYIVEEGCKRNFKFTAITNGYEIEHFLNLFGPDKIYRLQITIDGSKETHNKLRRHFKDGDTFDKIINNIELALNKNVLISVRMNSDKRNIEEYIKLKQYLKDRKILTHQNFYLYLGMLRNNQHITSVEQKKLDFLSAQSFINKQKEMGISPLREDDIGLPKKIYDAIVNNKPLPFTSISCGAQTGGNVFDPFGNIYPCWEVVGKKEYAKGIYSKEGVKWNNKIYSEWHNTDISNQYPCKHCRYALLCGGGCPYYRKQEDYKDCYLFKNLFNLAVNKAYADINNV